ncbi:hypothetical protein SV7mr_29800 [Stieleria bergensis]|uniref:Secreted protein n=1 Tax=Stieleria bergensis TaxID=2528025 RepID=A0A517SWE8_9BACT|nr:MAG: hypothetical protein CBB71_20900 [Rhodopirellula sp. TMED11]QDT60457.1 hypothetical protein SV7mr_29800 [Planctomycetes bacterium SV_7m_r]
MNHSLFAAAALASLAILGTSLTGCSGDQVGEPHATTNEIESFLKENPDMVEQASERAGNEETEFSADDESGQ